MYKCISQSENKDEMREQIIKQSKLGFFGYFLKKMFTNGLTFNQGIYVDKKKSLQIITPMQSLFLVARVYHVDECIPVLKEIYGNIPAEYLRRPGLKDVNCCIKLGDIYVTEEDTDVSLNNPGFLSKLRNSRKYNIYLPPKYTTTQLEELNNVIKVRELFKKWFFKDEIEVRHYKDYTMDDVEIYEGKSALSFLENQIEQENNVNVDNSIQHPYEVVFDLTKSKKSKTNNSFVDKADVNHGIPSIKNNNTSIDYFQSEPCK